jgi:hypothetical protein
MSSRRRSRSRSRSRRPQRSRLPAWQPRQRSNAAPGPAGHTRVVKWFAQSNVTSTVSAPGLYAFSFQLSDIPDYTHWAAVYDQYHFDRIDVEIQPLTQLGLPGAPPAFATLVAAVDYDDDSAPGSYSILANYSTAVQVNPGQRKMFSFRPKVNLELYSGSTSINAGIGTSWVNTADPSIPHFGLKVAVSTCSSTNVHYWNVLTRYHISFRTAR